jgi:hypothetical protein
VSTLPFLSHCFFWVRPSTLSTGRPRMATTRTIIIPLLTHIMAIHTKTIAGIALGIPILISTGVMWDPTFRLITPARILIQADRALSEAPELVEATIPVEQRGVDVLAPTEDVCTEGAFPRAATSERSPSDLSCAKQIKTTAFTIFRKG